MSSGWSRAAALLETLGLVLEPFGPGAVLVRETPSSLGALDATKLLRDLVGALAEDDAATTPLDRRLDHYLATFACHHSVQGRTDDSVGRGNERACSARWNGRPDRANATTAGRRMWS